MGPETYPKRGWSPSDRPSASFRDSTPAWHADPKAMLANVAGLGGLTLLVAIVAFSALRGGLWAFGDNPVHIAEIRDLARPGSRGWSDLGYGGFPLGILQSPLTFGALSLVYRLGWRLQSVYDLVLVGSLAAPAIAFYVVACKRLGPLWAFAMASTLVVYRGSLVGEAATLGGMFGFHYASAALVIVLDRLVRTSRNLVDAAILAALAAFIGLTHMFVTIALVHLALVHIGWSLWRRRDALHILRYDLAGLALGGLTAAAYWMPNLLAHTPPGTQPEPFVRIASRLITTAYPLPPPEIGNSLARILFDPIFQLDSAVQLVVCGLTVAGVALVTKDEDDVPRYGLTLGALFLAILAAEPWTRLALLGPQGMRLIYVAKLGFFLATIPIVRALSQKVKVGPLTTTTVGLAALSLGCLSQRLVSHHVVDRRGAEVTELESVWSWMRDHKTPSWGRVYVQDAIWVKSGYALEDSHLMAQTADHAQVEQLGSYYGSTPFVKAWIGNGGSLFGMPFTEPHFIDQTVTRMGRGNATHLLLIDPRLFQRFEADGRFVRLLRIGRYDLLERRGAVSHWAVVAGGTGDVSIKRVEPGRMHVTVEGPPTELSINESFHAFWRVEPPGAARLREDANGLMTVDRLAPGLRSFDVVYEPSALPGRITLVGGAGIVALFAVGAAFRRRSPALVPSLPVVPADGLADLEHG